MMEVRNKPRERYVMSQSWHPRPASDFAFQRILYEKGNGRARVTINRPEVYNAFDFQTLRELGRAFEDAAWDDSVGVLVLTGAGDRAFCTGADLREQEQHFTERPREYWKWMGAFIEAHDRLRNIGKPSIARLNGLVVGGGNELNLACDLAVAAEHVTIRQIGTARGSVAAGGATQWLPLVVGDRRAREIIYLCEEIPAPTALAWGLVNQVVPAAQLDEAVDQLAGKLLDKLPESIHYTKTQLNFWRDLSWNLTIQHARDWLTLHNTWPETSEGLAAFREKRLPDYESLRRRRANDESPEYVWGPPTATCAHCRASHVPARARYCPSCGEQLGG